MSTGAAWQRALVTGASGGIGEALARRLAARGCHLVLVARTVPALDQLAAELSAAHGVEAEVLPADLITEDGVAAVAARLADGAGPPVDLLVNNAGYGSAGKFAELDPARVAGEVRLNVLALVRLTSAAVPPMVARGRGSILNVSSVAGLQPIPNMATYAATKAFVTLFSESLHEELRAQNVTVTALLPGFTKTGFQARAGVSRLPTWAWMDAGQVADAALAATAEKATRLREAGEAAHAKALAEATQLMESGRAAHAKAQQ
ncbi:MAG: SDR family NAD(P)-dependent oxidoreductase, partial [Acidimicrobiia bacterium]